MLNGKPNTIGSTSFAKIQKNVWKNTIAVKITTKMKLIIVDLLRLAGLAAELLVSFRIVNDLSKTTLSRRRGPYKILM